MVLDVVLTHPSFLSASVVVAVVAVVVIVVAVAAAAWSPSSSIPFRGFVIILKLIVTMMMMITMIVVLVVNAVFLVVVVVVVTVNVAVTGSAVHISRLVWIVDCVCSVLFDGYCLKRFVRQRHQMSEGGEYKHSLDESLAVFY